MGVNHHTEAAFAQDRTPRPPATSRCRPGRDAADTGKDAVRQRDAGHHRSSRLAAGAVPPSSGGSAPVPADHAVPSHTRSCGTGSVAGSRGRPGNESGSGPTGTGTAGGVRGAPRHHRHHRHAGHGSRQRRRHGRRVQHRRRVGGPGRRRPPERPRPAVSPVPRTPRGQWLPVPARRQLRRAVPRREDAPQLRRALPRPPRAQRAPVRRPRVRRPRGGFGGHHRFLRPTAAAACASGAAGGAGAATTGTGGAIAGISGATTGTAADTGSGIAAACSIGAVASGAAFPDRGGHRTGCRQPRHSVRDLIRRRRHRSRHGRIVGHDAVQRVGGRLEDLGNRGWRRRELLHHVQAGHPRTRARPPPSPLRRGQRQRRHRGHGTDASDVGWHGLP